MIKHVLFAIAASVAVATPAKAVTVFSVASPTGQTGIPGSYTYNFNAGGGAGLLDFQIQGYNSVDGAANCCTDTLSVTLNSILILQGQYDLGGGGNNVTFVNTGGGTVNPISNGFFQGGTLTFSNGAVSLLNGSNSITFTYSGGNQGLGDEAWGINTATVQGSAFNAVPEPSAWALMLIGFGAVGGAMRSAKRRRKLADSYA